MGGPLFGDNATLFPNDTKALDAKLDKWVADAQAKAQRYQAIQAETAKLVITETSRDRLVTVTVDANGTVTELRLSDKVRELPAARTAETVLATIRRANSRIPARVAELMRAAAAEDPATVEKVVAGYRTRFPEMPPEPDTADITEIPVGYGEDQTAAPPQPASQPATPRAPQLVPQPVRRARPAPARPRPDDAEWEQPPIEWE